MAIDRIPEHKSVHQLAFAHYIRTGQRLTNAEWLARHERKFNPYHDERGRFTFASGAAASYGAHGAGAPADRTGHGTRSGHPSSHANPGKLGPPNAAASPGADQALAAKPPANAFRSEFVQNAVQVSGHAETYFELDERQAGLDRLREAAGPDPDPAVRADLNETQKRLDGDRARLDEITRQVIDPQTTELLRVAPPPLDVGIGAVNIATGKGEVRDYVAVAGAIPIVGTIGKVGKLAELGAAGEITEEAAASLPTIGGRAPINSRYAGQTHPSGVEFTEQGFPNFTPHSEAEVEIPNLTGNHGVDTRLANEAMGYPSTPKGYVWHHHENGTTMQLVPTSIHEDVKHTGGVAVIKNGGFDK